MAMTEPSIDIVVVVGNPSPGGRTTRAGQGVAAALMAGALTAPPGTAAAPGSQIQTIELADVAVQLFEWGNRQVEELLVRVARADVVVLASPVINATYAGLLKAFLDGYGRDGLAGCRAVPVMVGASPSHALAVDLHFRPLLVELGASVPSRGLYVLESQIDDLSTLVSAWAGQAVETVLAGLG